MHWREHGRRQSLQSALVLVKITQMDRSTAVTAADASGEIREVDGAQQTTGLLIYRASRLEKLLDPLVQLLAVTQPDNVLAPQTIIAAHPGMKQWLNGALARKYGGGGIAANLDILLPSPWIDRLARQQLKQGAVSLPRYQRQHLRWSIHEVLGGDVAVLGITDARIAGYLHADGTSQAGAADQARRRFQLADRLARIYSQYLVYRPDWLRGWEQGRFNVVNGNAAEPVLASTEQRLLAPLWRHLHRKLGAHRGDVVGDLIDHLGHTSAAGEVLHVFGVSHLAPSELAVLRAVARHRLVALYVPDPCREYWGGLGRTLPALRQQSADEQVRLDAAQGNDYWADQAHPLLASWGRMGQHFIMELAAGEGDVLSDVRHREDEQSLDGMNRLQRVQQGIRALDPALMDVQLTSPVDPAARADASLRVHSCHTPLRELEILRDQLLDALATADAEGKPIRPADIVVMAPDIQRYAPLIPAVFGVAGHAGGLLPYQLADVAVSRSHSLFGAFRQLLDLPGTRVTAPEVVDLLAVPEVSRRLNLDAAGVAELAEWLKSSRVAWGLDPAFRTRFGVPPIAEHTFGWAMDRMIAGYLMADAAEAERQSAVRLPDGTELAPLTGIHGPAAGYLGALDHLLQEVQTLCDLARESRHASDWAVELERRFEALFRIDAMDRAARDAKAMVLGFIRTIASEPASADEDPLLHFSVVRDLLVERLSAVPEQQRFLMGGITFCGMVPQRAIPFKVVAVLGLNDGDFPRSGSDAGLDLMARYRRMGDRDVRSDDRYLFLETLMSARERLHLSYIGEGVKDGKPRNPAPPLAELLAVLDAAAGLRPDDTSADRPWLLRHPLQPFDDRYFDAADARLFSYNALFAGMHGRGDQADVAPFLDHRDIQPIEVGPTIALRELHAYYRDPAKQLLEHRMQVSLDALEDDRLPQDEPIEAKFSALDTVAKRLFFNDALPGWPLTDWPPLRAPDWLRLGGIMPPGRAGELAWQQESGVVGMLLKELAKLPGFELGAPPGTSCEIDLAIDGRRVTGQVAHVYRTMIHGHQHWQLLRVFGGKNGKLKNEAELGFKERVPMFLDWALLRLLSARAGGNLPAVRLCPLLDGDERPWQQGIQRWDEVFMQADDTQRAALLSELEQRLQQLLHWWIEAQAAPRWYFPKSAWAAINERIHPKKRAQADDTDADEEDPKISIGSSWIAGHGGVGERDYAPGYSHLLAGDVEFADDSEELKSMAEFAMDLHRCISFESSAEISA
jgi:exodeoxyribonuclease V gamma subunit